MFDQPDSMGASEPRRPASLFRLNLEQQHKRAKELLKALRAGEADALRRFQLHHPRLSSVTGGPLPNHVAL